MNGVSEEVTASQCQTCPMHVARLGKGQKTCQTPRHTLDVLASAESSSAPMSRTLE